MLNSEQQGLLLVMQGVAKKRGEAVYVVGGVVRDLFLGQVLQDKDLDFIVEGNAIEFARALSRDVGGTLKEFPDFFTAKIEYPASFPSLAEIDLASVRIETYERPGELPKVKLAESIAQDLGRRDFSINAMALSLPDLIAWLAHGEYPLAELKDQAVDFYDGRRDLERRAIRVLHESSFSDDPTRIFRACRYAARLDGKIDQRSEELIRAAVAQRALQSISHFRKLNELRKIWEEAQPFPALGLLMRFAVFEDFKLFDSNQAELVFGAFARLAQLPIKADHPLRFEAFLALCFDSFASIEAHEVFKAMAIGKKQIAAFTSALEQARAFTGEELAELNDLAVILALSLGESEFSHPKLRAEALKRQIFHAAILEN